MPLPPGGCTLALGSDAAATVVALDGTPRAEPHRRRPPGRRRDLHRPARRLDTGTTATLSLTADTRFATTPSPLKIALAVGCLVALGVLFALLRSADRALPRVRLLPRGWWRPRPVDAVVTALLGVWWVIGSGTVDDGYIAGIVRSRGDNGFVGNVYRWLNAPEAPFGWFYEPYHWWSTISAATPWMRLPSTLLGLLCWFLVSRLLLPRLGRVGRLRGTPWVAALAFGTWWVPLDLGLRPEPWVAVGTVLAFLAVERAVATRRVLPLAAALTVAGATTAVTPGGVMAVAPVLAAAVPLLRGLRARTDLHLRAVLRAAPLVAALVAAGASALLLMAADQGAAALAEAVRVRGRIGGGLPWYEEFERYALLLTPGDVQGAIGRRAAVLATLLAVGGPGLDLAGRERSGVAAGPTRRLLVTLGLSAVAMMISPTKWTQHFGALTGLGTAALTLGLVVFGRRALAARARPGDRAAAAHRRARRRDGRVRAGARRAEHVAVRVGLVHAHVQHGAAARPDRAGGDDRAGGGRGGRRRAAGVVGVAAERGAPLRGRAHPRAGTRIAFRRRPRPSRSCSSPCWRCRCWASPASRSPTATATPPPRTRSPRVRGDPCGLQSALQVETDPAAGVLAVAPQPAPVPGVVPAPAVPPAVPAEVDAGGTTLPGIAVAGTGATSWFTLDARQRAGTLPVVVTVTGTLRPGDVLNAEFARGAVVLATVPLTGAADGAPTDRRLLAPPGADTVRLSGRRGRRRRRRRVAPPRARAHPDDAGAAARHPRDPRLAGRVRLPLPRPRAAPARAPRASRSGGSRRPPTTPRPRSPTRPGSAARSPGRGCWSRSGGCPPTCAATRPATASSSTAGYRSTPLRTLTPTVRDDADGPTPATCACP